MIKEAKKITDIGIGHLAQNCKALTKIDLHTTNITDEAIQEIGEHCHQLLSLCISSCPRLTDASLVSLGQGCINLRTLEVACCSHFTDNGFQALARITDATLNFLANYCPKISALTRLPNIKVHAYFAPVTPPPSVGNGRQRYCKCCVIL
ncbi:hypothetical protein KUTeg_000947 [Tegillarca granosa]|uniref:F-box/LRR-repeat protein 15-like leucin rich repeat domain-containing protein n=1 Tax=Tegillarca granosa TaxID=220873 RepID=A0ABQ9FW74_TEGGR|nr:hypothetical protein KUTeg_000947 [Tegillarca granosa]